MPGITEKTKKLKSGYEMPVLGLGTWELSGSACEEAVREAVELGYRHIDTAEMYRNEAEIGRALAKTDRTALFIASKVSSANLNRQPLLDACRRSLDRLGIDYLDLYLIHWPNDRIPIRETMEAMHQLVQEGLVRSIGVSNYDAGRLRDAIEVSPSPICNDQIEYHPYRHRGRIPEFCAQQGITTTAYCPLGRGRVLKDTLLADIGRQYDKSPAQVALRWLLQKDVMIIPKASSREHLRANMDLDGWQLSPDDISRIDHNNVDAALVDTTYT